MAAELLGISFFLFEKYGLTFFSDYLLFYRILREFIGVKLLDIFWTFAQIFQSWFLIFLHNFLNSTRFLFNSLLHNWLKKFPIPTSKDSRSTATHQPTRSLQPDLTQCLWTKTATYSVKISVKFPYPISLIPLSSPVQAKQKKNERRMDVKKYVYDLYMEPVSS